MFKLINEKHQVKILTITKLISHSEIDIIADELYELICEIREDIPEKKRISYGRYSIIKELGLKLYPLLLNNNVDTYSFSLELFENDDFDQFVRSLGVQLISIYGLEEDNIKKVLHVFEKAADDTHWEIQECSAGFIRKIIKKYPIEMKKWYLIQAKSNYPNIRRFSSESIRPVADNIWFENNPDFCFSILKNLFNESDPYPRTSVGNNLSDWSKIDKKRVYDIIEKLVRTKDKNSYWIAYRACRNLVKTEPIKVMDILGVDEYKYKKNIYLRDNYQ
jgi:3-methyladenine DNA glycosylase AlkC